MHDQNRVQLFDDWAEGYDPSIQAKDDFPFGGYEQVLDQITQSSAAKSGMSVLDLGIGTGNLAAKFASLGCELWGIDFSAEMLAKAQKLLPQASLIQADLLGEWPIDLSQRFDRIVSAYVLHEFELATQVKLLQRLAGRYLAPQGRILIGDVSFPTVVARAAARGKWASSWDDGEHYLAAEEFVQACQKVGLRAAYQQVSACGGVFVIKPATQS